ncbi:MAG: 1-phosphofructokinase [Armatimonadota bacterium]
MILTVTLNPAVDETITVPHLQIGETHRISATTFDPGGKGLNVARVVRRLGRSAVVVAPVGGETGDFVEYRLRREGVERRLVEIDAPTRVNISILDKTTQTNFNHEGPELAPSELDTVRREVEAGLPDAKLLVLGGSLPPGVPVNIYASLIESAGVPTVLDTSGEALAEGVRARPFMLKPNRREAEELLAMKIDGVAGAVTAGRRLIDLGIELAVISMGKDGLVAVSREGAWRAVPPDVPVGSTLGAGDSLVAGISIGVTEGMSLPESLALGTAAAAATVMTPGTELCRPEDVRELLLRVEVERL